MLIAISALALAHPVTKLFRSLLVRWCGLRLPNGFRALPEPVQLSTGYWWNGRSYERTRSDAESDLRLSRVLERAYWREVRWVLGPALVVAIVSGFPAYALFGAAILIASVTAPGIAAGVAVAAASLALAPFAWRATRPVAARWLTPGRSAAESQAQRADLTAAHDAEIRRIERDLHDGAQARLVAVGIDLATAERLLEREPDRARELLKLARAGTANSLEDLRGLVRGVYPPVLVERGFVAAVRAVALDSPVPIEVVAPDGLRLPSPVEATLYFGVVEALANMAKYSDAARGSVIVREEPGHVAVIVRDDGRGGAMIVAGGGLDGVRRRAGAFDGTLDVTSPSGGPTEITVRMPCALL
ncbi:sensor histidine kinase [Gryllotalpicola protaetiae]|uniref:sensor histidine kinase n=1 Tax=Gryllotalpicola protaetiae TaxID=2419771 RepID=UPI001C661253|nr:histidine kinase [Gryllotalpicola protaetiae]